MRSWNEPSRFVRSQDGTPIAVFTSGAGPSVVLVHGATADHTTFRVVRPLLEAVFTIHAVDRRGRGASGDTTPYEIAREFEDVAAVAETVARETGGPVDVVGHSYGGRCALGAALRTDAIRRVVCYEGAPAPPRHSYQPDGIRERLRSLLDAGDKPAVLATFMQEVVGMSEADLERFRADPVWPARVAAAGTILRELDAETSPAGSLEALGGVRQPVLQILGGASRPAFRVATTALDARLAHGEVLVIDGARHAAHHTHPDDFVTAVRGFLER
jgi:pimeloyl-ACP methyl ester carboxylesterase